MTTVSESNRVPETTLVPALQAQCQRRRQHALRPAAAAVLDPPAGTRVLTSP